MDLYQLLTTFEISQKNRYLLKFPDLKSLEPRNRRKIVASVTFCLNLSKQNMEKIQKDHAKSRICEALSSDIVY